VKFAHIALGIAVSAGLVAALSPKAESVPDKVVSVGYQKYGNLILLKGRGELQGKLAPLGFRVEWREFPSGPPLFEALNAGAIDFGHAGETPPIFAQAAGVPFVYVACEPPSPQGEAIVVRAGSPLKTLADLKGKKIALNKGSNVHYLLVRALERAGINYTEIEPIYLAPADARAAFERGAVEAWVIWDPFRAAVEVVGRARTLADGIGLAPNRQFYFAGRTFASKNPGAVDAVVAAISDIDRWAVDQQPAAAAQISAGVGVPASVLEIALKRQAYGVRLLDAETIDDQQQIADTFYGLGLLPKRVAISAAVWNRIP
jgi:sulfonate transport system substrate-binding protein